MSPSVTSCTLLDRAASREGAAWQGLVTLYAPLVQHWCRRAGVPPADVQDVAQDVFLSVSLSLAGFHRQALHAASLGFVHPRTKAPLSFESPLPDDLARLIKAMKTNDNGQYPTA